MTVGSPRLDFHRDDDVEFITLGDERHRNALNTSDWQLLADRVEALAADGTLRTLVIRGAGTDFCSGSNIYEWETAPPEKVEHSFVQMERAFTAIEDLLCPVIAAIDGVALGAGCQLALAADLRVMSRRAVIGMPVARLGILVSPAFANRLLMLAGVEMSKLLLMTGRTVGAESALRSGLVTTICQPEELEGTYQRLAREIGALPQEAVAAAKGAIAANIRPTREAASARVTGPPVSHRSLLSAVREFVRTRNAGDGQAREQVQETTVLGPSDAASTSAG